MTQIYLNPFRPERGELRQMRKLARNYRAQYQQYQTAADLIAATTNGRWIALESRARGSVSVHDVDWFELMHETFAVAEGLHIVTGSMNHGLPAEVLDMMDYHVHVPQFDDVPFLAPATAAAITLDRIFMATANRARVFG